MLNITKTGYFLIALFLGVYISTIVYIFYKISIIKILFNENQIMLQSLLDSIQQLEVLITNLSTPPVETYTRYVYLIVPAILISAGIVFLIVSPLDQTRLIDSVEKLVQGHYNEIFARLTRIETHPLLEVIKRKRDVLTQLSSRPGIGDPIYQTQIDPMVEIILSPTEIAVGSVLDSMIETVINTSL